MVLWAGNSIVGRAVHDSVPPFLLAFVRWSGALLIITPFALPAVVKDARSLFRHWATVLLLGATGVAAFNAFLYAGLRYAPATDGVLLQALIPPLVLVFSWLIFRERMVPGQVAGVILSTLGAAAIVGKGDITNLLKLRIGLGDGLILCGVCSWALYTSLLRLKPDVRPMSFLFATFAVGALLMAPLAATEFAQIAAMTITPAVIGAFAYVAILPSVVAYFLYNEAVETLGAGPAGQTMSLTPVFGAGLAAMLLREPLHIYDLAGLALIIGGIAITAWSMLSQRRREPVHS
jgi:drug/metabolite transporter (DMT)-like permease